MKSSSIPLWVAQALPASGSVTSPQPIHLDQIFGFAVQVTWTGTPVGVFTLQGSCDQGVIQPGNVITGVTNWTTITNTSSNAGGAPGTLLYNISDVMYLWFRLVYTATSSTGTANARCSVKGV